MCHGPSGVAGPPLVGPAALSVGLPGARSEKTHHAKNPPTASTMMTSAPKTNLSARRNLAPSVGDDAERTPHERVDPAEVRVGARRQVPRRRPRHPARGGRSAVAELTGVEDDLAVRDGVRDAGAAVARRGAVG